MSLIEIPDELESQVRNAAARHGQALPDYVVATLEARLRAEERTPEKIRQGHEDLVAFFEGVWESMSPEEIAASPGDLAEEHDHYIYGIPKRRGNRE